jgi:hypothetical protein
MTGDLSIEQEFSAALGTSIYSVLPGVVESTFGPSNGRYAPLAPSTEHLE